MHPRPGLTSQPGHGCRDSWISRIPGSGIQESVSRTRQLADTFFRWEVRVVRKVVKCIVFHGKVFGISCFRRKRRPPAQRFGAFFTFLAKNTTLLVGKTMHFLENGRKVAFLVEFLEKWSNRSPQNGRQDDPLAEMCRKVAVFTSKSGHPCSWEEGCRFA